MGPRTENHIRATMQGILATLSSSSVDNGGVVPTSSSEQFRERIKAFAVKGAIESFCSNSAKKDKWLARTGEWMTISKINTERDSIIDALTAAPPAPIGGVSGGTRGGGSGFFGAVFETSPDNGKIVETTMRTFNASFEEDDLEILISKTEIDIRNLLNTQDIGKVYISTSRRLSGVVRGLEENVQYLSISILNKSGRRLKCLIRHCVCESILDRTNIEKRLTYSNGKHGGLSFFELEGDVNYKNGGSFIGIGELATFTVCSGIKSNNSIGYALMCLFSM